MKVLRISLWLIATSVVTLGTMAMGVHPVLVSFAGTGTSVLSFPWNMR